MERKKKWIEKYGNRAAVFFSSGKEEKKVGIFLLLYFAYAFIFADATALLDFPFSFHASKHRNEK